MSIIKTLVTVHLLLACAVTTYAQVNHSDASPARSPLTVTISTSARGIRVVGLGSIKQMRLEVFSSGGDSLYRSEFQDGNVRDWALEDGQGQRLPDGAYLCLVTVRDVSGRLSVKQGSVLLQSGQASVQLGEAEQAGAVETGKGLAPVTSEAATAVALTAHDGSDGQIVSTRGGLSFRAGDFFAGKDRELMRVTAEGNLGVGTSSPKARLDVAGQIRARGGIVFDDGTVLNSANLAGFGALTSTSPTTAAAIAGSGTTGRIMKWTDGANAVAGDSVLTEVSGKVGIGTSSPATALEVNGAATFGAAGQGRVLLDSSSPGNNLTFNVSGANGYLYFNPSSGFTIFKAPAGTPGQLQVESSGASPLSGTVRSWNGTTNANSPLLFYTAGMNLSNNQLQAGDMKFYPGLSFDLTTRIGNHSIFFSPSGVGKTVFENGNVGVGISNPQAKLHVAGAARVEGDLTVTGSIVGTLPTDSTSYIQNTASQQSSSNFNISGSGTVGGTLTSGGLAVDAGTLFVSAANDRVGVGTTNPQARLDVVGDIKVSGNAVVDGNIAAKYQDVAEWVPARQQLAAGTVVALDTTRTNAVAPSARAYDTRVAGVVSAQPGVILGEGGEGKVLVATTGRVKVRVDAGRHPIRIGDLLVTSNKPGVAMRSQPIRVGRRLLHRPGTIIGKAVEALASGEGEILVLLSMQ